MKRIAKPSEEPAGVPAENAPQAPQQPHAPRPGGYEHHAIGQGGQPGRGRPTPVPPGPAPRNRPNSPARTRRGR